jgi:ABC-2 type transport system ATP-binding protein
MAITVNGLTKRYGAQTAVNQISFSVGKGEIVGFLGPNGAGKSTTMKMITGYIDADGGSATVCGLPCGTTAIEAKQKIGYMPEANPLYGDMYVKEYLGFTADTHQVPRKKERVAEVIALVGLTAESHKKIHQLSKGYKQRVGLAAALLHDPDVLILDEPTSGLDPNQIVEIREVIRNLGKNKTVLFSSHILQEVTALCERVVIINKGNIVADEKIGNLLGKKQVGELKLELKEAVEESVFEGIQNIKRVNANTWLFRADDTDKLKRQLLELTIAKNLNIVSLQSGATGSLEEIFRSLTQQ